MLQEGGRGEQGTFKMPTTGESVPRLYRSRKQKPCDNCRTRRTCCIRGVSEDCALCNARGVRCTFSSKPPTRKRHPKCAPLQRALSNAISSADTAPSLAEQEAGAGNSRQWVGLSGVDDPYFVSPPSEARGNLIADQEHATKPNPDFRSYFKNFRSISSPPIASPDARIQTESDLQKLRADLRLAYFDVVHLSFPLLDEAYAIKDDCCDLLHASIAILAKPYCENANGLNLDALAEKFLGSLLLQMRHPTLETVEAAIIFANRPNQVQNGMNTAGSWAVIGSLVGLCHDLGLHLDSSSWPIPPGDKRRRKRLWWALYMQDKWFAMVLGRPPYLQQSQTNVPMVNLGDFLIVNQEIITRQSIGAHCFVAMAELSLLLSDILSSFYTLDAVLKLRNTETQHILDIVQNIEDRLAAWQSEFLDPLLENKFFPDITGSVELGYLTAKIMLLRATCPKLVKRNFPLSKYFDDAISVSSRATQLVETLQISRLSAFWWSPSGFNFTLAGTFMDTMRRIGTRLEHRKHWADQLTYYRKLLRAHAVGFEPAKLATAMLDNILKDLPQEADNGHTVDHATGKLNSDKETPSGNFDANAFISQSTEPVASFDIVSSDLMKLDGIDFEMDWLVGSGFGWGAENCM